MEWISVKTSLPSGTVETAPEVLITDGKTISVGYHEYNMEETDPETGNYFPEESLWHDDAHILRTDWDGYPEVTHWMPLPQPPKD